ncbi:MAG: hypothetical protein HZB61_14675 [Nitrospirae bacterium]|nr:hypothetical protein [Nitrospirota bacterium]
MPIMSSAVVVTTPSTIVATGISTALATGKFVTRYNPSVTWYKTAVTRDKQDND